MAKQQLEHDLVFIKQTMEQAGRYRNLPPLGYLTIGLLGLAGACGSYVLLGPEKASRLSVLTTDDLWTMVLLWSMILLLSLVSMTLFTVLRARRLGLQAWNALAARMFLSQFPLVLVSGLLTLALGRAGQVGLIPALWLCQYACITYSFSYFTSTDHKIQGLVFLLLGALALVLAERYALIVLAVGFGGVHLVFGLFRLWTDEARHHEPQQAR